MYAWKLDRKKLIGLVSLSFLMLFIVSCGSNANSTTTASAAATATCVPNRLRSATGTVQSVNGTSLLLKNLQGKSVQASYTDKTRFQQEKAVTTSALKEGTFVSIVVNQGSNSTYTATLITLVANRGNGTAGNGFGGGTGGARGTPQARNANCFRQRQGGTPGTFPAGTGTAGASRSTSTRGITGTVGQLSGSALTVTDPQGSDYSIALNASTKIIQFGTATASVLKTGTSLSVTGSDDGKGGITAQNITILLPGTTGRAG